MGIRNKQGMYECWYMSADEYLERAIPTIEAKMGKLSTKYVDSPLPKGYHPELDTSRELH